jgi:hypothetical protein
MSARRDAMRRTTLAAEFARVRDSEAARVEREQLLRRKGEAFDELAALARRLVLWPHERAEIDALVRRVEAGT